MNLQQLLERALTGLGYELVDTEISGRRKLLRVFIDKSGGVSVDDCVRVSNHLTRLFAVENVAYERLEVSSPGLDRPLTKAADFVRFAGERARIRVRHPIQGRRNFTGVLEGVHEGKLQVQVDGAPLTVDLVDLEKARLVPKF